MKFNDFDWNDIIMEAPEDNTEDDLGGEEELTATDYADAENMNIEEEDPAAEDNTEEDNPTDDTGEDNLEDGGEDDLNLDEDPLGDEEGNTDETTEDEQTDNGDETENVSDEQNKYLVQDFIELFNRMEEIQEIMRNNNKLSLRANPVYNKVRQNLEKLNDVTYDYIVNKFSKNSYVANLYQFNLIIQALNINIQMLELNMDLNIKNVKDKDKNKQKRQK